MPTLKEQVDELLRAHPQWDQHQVARHLIEQAIETGPDAVVELAEPSLANTVWNRLRQRMRAQEAKVLNDITRGNAAREEFDIEYDPLEDLARILDHSFTLKGRTIRYRDATIIDWQARKVRLEHQEIQLKQHLASCETAIDVLRRHRSNTLGEAWDKTQKTLAKSEKKVS